MILALAYVRVGISRRIDTYRARRVHAGRHRRA